jgi:hypothetical protein
MSDAEIMAEARAMVEAGWCQRMEYDYEGNFCAIGAIREATARHAGTSTRDWSIYMQTVHRASTALVSAINENFPAPPGNFKWSSVPAWNDRPERTKEDVILAFKHAEEALS